MAQVQIFEPWHVAVRNSVRRFIPSSNAGRVLVGATGGAAAVALSLTAVWIGQRADALLFLGNLGIQQLRGIVVSGVTSGVTAVLGDGAAAAIQSGGPAVLVGSVAAGAAALGIVAFGVKAVATAGRRRGS